MPNFDQCERYLRAALASQDAKRRKDEAHSIFTLPERNKALIFKRRSEQEISAFLSRASRALDKYVAAETGARQRFKFTTSEDNKRGKDLTEIKTGLEIELKSGDKRTDANVGLATVAWALGDSGPEELRRILGSDRQARVGQAISAYRAGRGFPTNLPLETELSKKSTMNQFFEYARLRLKLGGTAPGELERLVRCVSVGLTKGDQIRASLDNPQDEEKPLLLACDWDEGLKPYEASFLTKERIKVADVRQTTKRAQILIEGRTSGTGAVLYPHFKNSRAVAGLPEKIPASYWTCSPCFHVWIRPSGADGD